MPHIDKESKDRVLKLGSASAGELTYELFRELVKEFKKSQKRYADRIGIFNVANQLYYISSLIMISNVVSNCGSFKQKYQPLVLSCLELINNFPKDDPEHRIIGQEAILGASIEFRRLYVDPYEEEKIKENGGAFND